MDITRVAPVQVTHYYTGTRPPPQKGRFGESGPPPAKSVSRLAAMLLAGAK